MSLISQRIASGYYRNPDKRPKRPSKPIPIFTVGSETAKDVQAYASALVLWEERSSLVEQDILRWHDVDQQRMALFKADLEAEFGIQLHPKAGMLYERSCLLARFPEASQDWMENVYSNYRTLISLIL